MANITLPARTITDPAVNANGQIWRIERNNGRWSITYIYDPGTGLTEDVKTFTYEQGGVLPPAAAITALQTFITTLAADVKPRLGF